jgi:signal peptidase I
MTDSTEPGGTVPPGSGDDAAAAQPPSPPPPDADASLWGRYQARRRARRAAKAAKPRRKAPWWELPLLIVIAIVIAILVKTFVVQPFYIPSESMEKTLAGSARLGHDRILVNKLIFDFRDPHPGDIVVFHAPKGWDDEPTSKPPSNPILRVVRGFGQLVGFVPPDGQVLVKRVIAMGGQTVKGDAQGEVFVSKHGPNGPFKKLVEPYVYRNSAGDGDFGHAKFGPVTVPKGRLWVMGDHRDDSQDSRFHCGPNADDVTEPTSCDPRTSTVPVDDVIGKAFVVAWPPSHWRTLGTPSTFEDLASGPAFPGVVGAAVVAPVFLVRRRRRRR